MAEARREIFVTLLMIIESVDHLNKLVAELGACDCASRGGCNG